MRRIRLSMLTVTLILLASCASGCGLVKTRTVLIPQGEAVQLAEPVEAYVYVTVGGKRERSGNRVTLPEGWYCLPK